MALNGGGGQSRLRARGKWARDRGGGRTACCLLLARQGGPWPDVRPLTSLARSFWLPLPSSPLLRGPSCLALAPPAGMPYAGGDGGGGGDWDSRKRSYDHGGNSAEPAAKKHNDGGGSHGGGSHRGGGGSDEGDRCVVKVGFAFPELCRGKDACATAAMRARTGTHACCCAHSKPGPREARGPATFFRSAGGLYIYICPLLFASLGGEVWFMRVLAIG